MLSVETDRVIVSRRSISSSIEPFHFTRVKARGHAMLEEKQLKFRIGRYSNIAHLWSSYTLQSDGKQVARGINSIQAIKIQAIKEAGGWRVTGIMVQAESVTAPLPKEYLP
jgi:hypothetical protein